MPDIARAVCDLRQRQLHALERRVFVVLIEQDLRFEEFGRGGVFACSPGAQATRAQVCPAACAKSAEKRIAVARKAVIPAAAMGNRDPLVDMTLFSTQQRL